jgi:hypothetical protein
MCASGDVMCGTPGETPGRGVPRIFSELAREYVAAGTGDLAGDTRRKNKGGFSCARAGGSRGAHPWLDCSRLLLERGERRYGFQGELLEAVIMLHLRVSGFFGGFIQDEARQMSCQAVCHVFCHVLSTAAKSRAPPDMAVASSGQKILCDPPIDVARQHNYCGELLQTSRTCASSLHHPTT